MHSSKSVVITGIGPLCSIGIGKDELWKSVIGEKTNIVAQKFRIGADTEESYRLHKISNFDLKNFDINPGIVDWIRDWKNGHDDIDLQYMAVASKLAIDDSGLKFDETNNNVGFIVTQENPGLEDFFNSTLESGYDYLKANPLAPKSEFIRDVYNKCERMGYDSQSFMCLFFLSKIFSTHGFSLFVNNACASGLYALEIGSQQIREERCSAVIVVGSDSQKMIYKHWWLKKMGLTSDDGVIRPYSKKRNGFIMGEGGAALVLESRDSAEKRGAHIYAEYLGGGFNLEGGRVSLPTVEKDYYGQCIRESLSNARLVPEDIDLVNPHGIGTSITDLHEARTISTVFSASKNYTVSAFKPYFGHNLGSCALLECSLLLTALEKNFIPRSLDSEPVDDNITIPIATHSSQKPLRTVLKLSCGFAGYNGASIFRKISGQA